MCANEGVVSVMTILKNPMILLGLVSMGIFLGMPYLVDNSSSYPNLLFSQVRRGTNAN